MTRTAPNFRLLLIACLGASAAVAGAVEVGPGPAVAERAPAAVEVGPGSAVAERAAGAMEVGPRPAVAERAPGAVEVGPGPALAERAAGAAAAAGTVQAAGAAAPPAARVTGFQDIAQLEAAAKSAAAPSLPAPTARQRLQVGPIQSGLRLARCENGVKPVIAPGLRERSRVLIELRCDGPSSWHIYVPVRVVGTSAVVMAAHAIVAGSVLTDKDVVVEQRDLTALPVGYFDDAALTIGMTAGRAIAGGAVLTNQQLLGVKAVERGQTVTLIADGGGMSVRMAGRALADGLINQRVRVQNLSSGRVVEGIARSEQVVEIFFK